MADNRFVETICEILGVKSPAEIKREELRKLVIEHFGEQLEDLDLIESETGIMYKIFDEDLPEEE